MIKKITFTLFVFTQLVTFSQNYDFGKVSKEELQEQFYPLDSTADAAYLYRSRKTYYIFSQQTGDFQLVTEIHERIKIYTKEGFDFANRYVSYYKPDSGNEETVTSIKGYTFNVSKGKVSKDKLSSKNIFDEKKNKYRSIRKMIMPNVKVGSVIEIKYKIISPYKSIDDLQFQYEIPVKKLEYKVSIPEYYTYNIKSKGYYFIDPVQRKGRGSFTIRSKSRSGIGRIPSSTSYNQDNIDYTTNIKEFNATDIPALKDNEPFVGSIQSYRGGVKFELSSTNFLAVGGGVKNYTTTWEDVSKEIYKRSSFGPEIEKTSYFKNDLELILANTKNDTEKVLAIFQFIKSKVKWNDIYGIYTDKGVRRAYKDGVGSVADINLMLTSMLSFAGLNANPVLVSTRNNGVPMFPTLDGFNYVISMVEFNNGTYALLDATELYSLPNILPTRDLNWNGRKVNKEGNSSWIKLTPSKFASEENLIMVKVTEDLIVEGFVRTKYDNLNALNFRNNYNHIKEENLITKFEENNKVEIINFKITNKYEMGKPVNRTLKFSSEDLIEEISNRLYIEPLLFLTEHENPFKLEERKFPIDFASPWKDKNTVSIQIPEGYKVEKLPESFAIALPDNLGVFKYQVTQMGKKISTIAILQFNSAIIGAENYKVLKQFYGDLVKKQSEKIVLIKE